ncbi:MAG: type II toxin-antitoxin system VapC family toxin [Thermoproteota archaeon]
MRERAVELAYGFGITLYDAVYVSLAVLHNATLYTADREVVAKTPLTNVKHLSEVEK